MSKAHKPSLDPSRAKLAQARHHLKRLSDGIRDFMETNPFAVRHAIDRKTGDDVWRLVVRQAPPLSLRIMAGDVAHNLRSSLDQLVWQLALTQARTPYSRTQFPIYSKKLDFDNQGMAQIQDVPSDAKMLIRSVQPYRRTLIGHTLALLSEISNTDKHRVPIRVLARQIALDIPFWCIDYLESITGTRKDGDIVLRLLQEPGRPDLDEHDMKKVRVIFDLGFNTPREEGIIGTFNEMHQTIDEVLIANCERFFR